MDDFQWDHATNTCFTCIPIRDHKVRVRVAGRRHWDGRKFGSFLYLPRFACSCGVLAMASSQTKLNCFAGVLRIIHFVVGVRVGWRPMFTGYLNVVTCRIFGAPHSPFHLFPVDSYESMWSILHWLNRSLKPELYLVSLVVCWKIWEVRNLEVHGETRGFPAVLSLGPKII